MSTYEQRAERFVAGYEPDVDDHPDLASRVVMYERAVAGGDKRHVAAHARTLVRYLEHVEQLGDVEDVEVLKGKVLDEALKAADLSTAGTADQKRARLAEHQASSEV